jgi:two-component system chemotaxis response regulator CheY
LKNILFVDDSLTVLTTVEHSLKKMVNDGIINLLTYNSPTILLEDVSSNKLGSIDMIFCDINMPDINGLDLIQSLKSNHLYSSVPVMMLTTEVASHLKERSKTLGVIGWVTKPFSPRKLQLAISKVLRLKI